MRTVLFIFAGREANLRVQRPYLDALVRDHGVEVEYWDLTRNREDHAYVQSLRDPAAGFTVRSELYAPNDWPLALCRKRAARPRWCGCRDCRPAPYEKVYQAYAADPSYDGAVFVKMDDDIVFIETRRWADLVGVLDEHPNAVVSANVVNNVVSAKHDLWLRPMIENRFGPVTQRQWFDLHARPEFASVSHDWFLSRWRDLLSEGPAEVTRALPGERPSINTIAFTHPTMVRLAATMRNRWFQKMGDEGSVCQNFLPRIVTTFRTAHLYFGPQRVGLPDEQWADYLAAYAVVATEYLR